MSKIEVMFHNAFKEAEYRSGRANSKRKEREL